eukprot:COSAG02_NODE_27989_length_598_cov_2.434870_2_plen_63_part_01
MVENLIEADALAAPNKAGDLPLHVALRHQAPPEVVLLLLRQHQEAAKEQDAEGQNLLECAVMC